MAKNLDRGKGPSQRQLRVGELVRHALTQILQRGEISDDEITGVVLSVSEVSMSPDLKHATAYITPLGDGDAGAIARALNSHAKFIRGQLTPHLRQMKFMPDVKFRADTSFDNYSKIDALLKSPEVKRDLESDDR